MDKKREAVVGAEKRIGRFLRDRRMAAGLSQQDLAGRCGIVRRTLFSLESGQGGNLRVLLTVLEELGALPDFVRFARDGRGAHGKPRQARRRESTRRSDGPGGGKRSISPGNPWVLNRTSHGKYGLEDHIVL